MEDVGLKIKIGADFSEVTTDFKSVVSELGKPIKIPPVKIAFEKPTIPQIAPPKIAPVKVQVEPVKIPNIQPVKVDVIPEFKQLSTTLKPLSVPVEPFVLPLTATKLVPIKLPVEPFVLPLTTTKLAPVKLPVEPFVLPLTTTKIAPAKLIVEPVLLPVPEAKIKPQKIPVELGAIPPVPEAKIKPQKIPIELGTIPPIPQSKVTPIEIPVLPVKLPAIPNVKPITIPVDVQIIQAQESLARFESALTKAVKPEAVDNLKNHIQGLKEKIATLSGAPIADPFPAVVAGSGKAVSSLTILQNQLARLQKIAISPTLDFRGLERVNGLLLKTQNQITTFSKAASVAVPVGFRKGTNEAAQSLTNLSRIAQDAPFGFIGIQNNLNPLLESFQRLRASSTSNVDAFKKLGSSLLGAGGIGLALGVVSSLFLVFGDRLFKSGDAASRHAKKLKDAKEALIQYAEGLDEITGARLKGLQGAQEEIVKLDLLYKATQNQNISLGDRKKLVDELQNQYPKYFQSLSDETILAGGAEDAYKKLATAILASARARAAQEALVEVQKQILTNEQKSVDKLTEQDALVRKINIEKAKGVKIEGARGEEIQTDAGKEVVKLSKQLRETENETNKVYAERVRLQKIANGLITDANKIVEQNPDALIKDVKVAPPKDIKFDKVRATVESLEIDIKKIEALNFEDAMRGIQRMAQEGIDKLPGIALDIEMPKIKVPEVDWDAVFNQNAADEIKERSENVKAALANIGALGTDAIFALGDAFASFGDALFRGENALKAFGQSIVQAFGQVIAQLLKTAAIAAVLSAITGGSAAPISFLNAFKGLLGLAEGGIVTRPTLAMIGEGGEREAIIPISKLNQFISKNAQGGAVQLYGEFRQRGPDLVAIVRQEIKRQGRNR